MGVKISDDYGDLQPPYSPTYWNKPLGGPGVVEEQGAETAPRFDFVAGGSFILDTSPDPEPLWGSGDDVLLADGEALIIAARGGLGKTTLAQQLTLGRCGFPEYSELLGYPIKPGDRRVLYLAMDRPRQIARSFRRMVGSSWRDELNERLIVWQGPPPADLAKHPGYLLALCEAAEADTVVVDSLKDAAVGLSEDDVGAGYNRARQKAITAGVQVVELHHNRKELSGAKESRLTIDDLYGSTWLPAGAGSVLILTGAPGDPIVGLHHVKQPVAEVGPLQIVHDHDQGRTTVWHTADLVILANANANGLTAKDAAAALYTTDAPHPAQVEKARRKLDKLANSGMLRRLDGDRATATPARYIPALEVAS